MKDKWKPIISELERIDPDAISDINDIYTRNNRIRFRVGGNEYVYSFLTSKNMFIYETGLEISIDKHRAWIAIDQIFSFDILADVKTKTLPEDVLKAYVESLIEPFLDQLEQWSHTKAKLKRVVIEPEFFHDFGYNLYFKIHRKKDAIDTWGHMSMDRAGLKWLAKLFRDRFTLAKIRDYNNIHVPVSIVLGRTYLSIKALRNLKLFEIVPIDVLVDVVADGIGKNDILRQYEINLTDRLRWKCVLKEDQIFINKRLEALMDKKNGNKIDSTNGESLSDLDEIEVELVFEIGRKMLALSDLRKLQSGYVFDLDQTIDRPVLIKANGKIIGQGEIVRLENRVGVRLLDLFKQE